MENRGYSIYEIGILGGNDKGEIKFILFLMFLYSKYLQYRYDEFKNIVKPIEDKIIRGVHRDFEFEYNLCIDGAGKYVNVILKSKTSIFSMAVEVRLDYFFQPFDSDSHISNLSSKYELIGVYDSIKELKKRICFFSRRI